MAVYYLDTSALVKLYVDEPGTDTMIELTVANQRNQFAILAATKTELHSAVRGRERQGDLDSRNTDRILHEFSRHLETMFVRQAVSDPVIDLAALLVQHHPLRANDALQLAGCLVLRAGAWLTPVFACSDRALLRAADAEGLVCFDPTG